MNASHKSSLIQMNPSWAAVDEDLKELRKQLNRLIAREPQAMAGIGEKSRHLLLSLLVPLWRAARAHQQPNNTKRGGAARALYEKRFKQINQAHLQSIQMPASHLTLWSVPLPIMNVRLPLILGNSFIRGASLKEMFELQVKTVDRQQRRFYELRNQLQQSLTPEQSRIIRELQALKDIRLSALYCG